MERLLLTNRREITMLTCHICGKPRDKRYENRAASESCVHPCHWPYLSSAQVAAASIALDKINGHGVNVSALKQAWGQ